MQNLLPFEIFAEVKLTEPLSATDPETGEPSPLIGYIRFYGVYADSLQTAIQLVANDITDGEITEMRGHQKQLTGMNDKMRATLPNPPLPGIWYRSGRAFWSTDESTRR